VKTGIQENEEDNWISAPAEGMTDRRRKTGRVDFESTHDFKPLAFKARVI
jgi:hypothetical protein